MTEDFTAAPASPPEDDAPLPELQEALLEDATLDVLFADVAHGTEPVAIVYRDGGGRSVVRPGAREMREAREALRAGTTRGLQLRYMYRGVEWWDTLMPVPGGARLVRIGHGGR